MYDKVLKGSNASALHMQHLNLLTFVLSFWNFHKGSQMPNTHTHTPIHPPTPPPPQTHTHTHKYTTKIKTKNTNDKKILFVFKKKTYDKLLLNLQVPMLPSIATQGHHNFPAIAILV